jgi:hypothetical protein
MSKVKQALKNLTHEELEEIKQYATSIKEIKKKMAKMLHKAKSDIDEGGNMSSGLVLDDDIE